MQTVVKLTEDMDTGEVIARPQQKIGPEVLEGLAQEHLDAPILLTRDGQYWLSAKTGHLVGFK